MLYLFLFLSFLRIARFSALPFGFIEATGIVADGEGGGVIVIVIVVVIVIVIVIIVFVFVFHVPLYYTAQSSIGLCLNQL